MKKTRSFKTLVGIAFLAIVLFSCEKKEDDPAYVGTWVATEEMEFMEPGTMIPVQMTLILSKSNFEWKIAASLSGVLIDVGAVKGDLTATDTEFTIMPTSAGTPGQSGSLEWVNKGEAGFEEALANWEMSESMTSAYAVVGNTLTISIDDVPMVFTRQ
jgi:hypothetical protein